MKKHVLLSSFFLLLTFFSVVSAYTQIDVENANFLAEKKVITKQSDVTLYRLDNTITRAEAV